ncbi:hypothetical protein G4B88_000642 [Cannabis sativa]|uniref:PB1 domain-containing protein n=1 Tax=Cannabis sativa TaxID=3483 RepID=A0A7J6HGT7_CANSA|nr:hypothetical protein G4B88_000642 [Cannabis sativa]
MGKPSRKKKEMDLQQRGNANRLPSKLCDRTRSSKAFDEDTLIFINMSQQLKDEGNKLFRQHDHEGAMLKYEKALKLLPKAHIDVSHLHIKMAACYMQMGLSEYPRAINECNQALDISPRYSKALLQRAKCYEALNRLDLAYRDVNGVLSMEPNNLNASEILKELKKVMSKKGIAIDEKEIGVSIVEESGSSKFLEVAKEELNKGKMVEDISAAKVGGPNTASSVRENKIEIRTAIVEEPIKVEKVLINVKIVLGEDIRWAQLPTNCNMKLLSETVKDRFPSVEGVLVKYKDQEGDFVTLTTTDELRLTEYFGDMQGSIKLYITEANPDNGQIYERTSDEGLEDSRNNCFEDGVVGKGVTKWILQFAKLFKNHVGFDSDCYLDLHEVGLKLHSEATMGKVASDDAQQLLDIAANKFQEMTALALFNWGNVHMSKARKRVPFAEGASRDQIVEQIKVAYDWAQKEYMEAEKKYEKSLQIKPDFYEGFLALGHQQFEQAKLCWYYSVERNVELETALSSEVLQLYNKAEDNMERGMLMWEEIEEQRLNKLSKADKLKAQLHKIGSDAFVRDVAPSVASEQDDNIKSQIFLLWGTLLYERSIVEYKIGLPAWEESLEVSVEKFELAGASPTDISVMIKNHCSNENALEGLGFKIDEIVQAWNEMYDARRWRFGVSSVRLQPLFPRWVPKLHFMLEQA